MHLEKNRVSLDSYPKVIAGYVFVFTLHVELAQEITAR